jgi:hypothetical protein
MQRPLEASFFRPAAPPPLSAAPDISRLAAQLGEACLRSLARLRPAGWAVVLDRIEERADPPGETGGRHVRLESALGSLTLHLSLDRPAISAITEAALGGTGAEQAFGLTDRPLSRIETGLIQMVEASLAGELATALTQHFSRAFSKFEDGDPPPITGRADELAQFRYIINVFSYSGELRLTFNAAELRCQMSAAGQADGDDAPAALRQHFQNEVGKSDMVLTVMLGPETFSLEDVAGFRPGQLLELSSTVAGEVTVWSEGVASFRGRLARSGERLAVALSAVNT